MTGHKIVSQEQWLEARLAHLEKEKEFTHLRDELTRQRRELPWAKIDKRYVFKGPEGEESLGDLFGDRTQLIVQHFMFGPEWQEGCPSCSFWADNLNGVAVHLAHRDASLVMISNTPFAKLDEYRERMGWNLKWVSSLGSDFNRDFQVSFTEEETASGQMYYNYQMTRFPSSEGAGVSVFYTDGNDVFHTYSCYARGLDMLNGAYHYIDITPKGRDESAGNMHWLRRNDQYDD